MSSPRNVRIPETNPNPSKTQQPSCPPLLPRKKYNEGDRFRYCRDPTPSNTSDATPARLTRICFLGPCKMPSPPACQRRPDRQTAKPEKNGWTCWGVGPLEQRPMLPLVRPMVPHSVEILYISLFLQVAQVGKGMARVGVRHEEQINLYKSQFEQEDSHSIGCWLNTPSYRPMTSNLFEDPCNEGESCQSSGKSRYVCTPKIPNAWDHYQLLVMN